MQPNLRGSSRVIDKIIMKEKTNVYVEVRILLVHGTTNGKVNCYLFAVVMKYTF
jgi:hypothetical protein